MSDYDNLRIKIRSSELSRELNFINTGMRGDEEYTMLFSSRDMTPEQRRAGLALGWFRKSRFSPVKTPYLGSKVQKGEDDVYVVAEEDIIEFSSKPSKDEVLTAIVALARGQNVVLDNDAHPSYRHCPLNDCPFRSAAIKLEEFTKSK
ncbi:MAG: hypothetical protein KAS32_08365 [Candidatus Peribacteraceae bacterium]|nr:hypothetical protein [Candidatus Peribacteraceae bacterium]